MRRHEFTLPSKNKKPSKAQQQPPPPSFAKVGKFKAAAEDPLQFQLPLSDDPQLVSESMRTNAKLQMFRVLTQNTHFPKNPSTPAKLERKSKALENQIFGEYYNNAEQYEFWVDKVKTFLLKIHKFREISRTLHRKEYSI